MLGARRTVRRSEFLGSFEMDSPLLGMAVGKARQMAAQSRAYADGLEEANATIREANRIISEQRDRIQELEAAVAGMTSDLSRANHEIERLAGIAADVPRLNAALRALRQAAALQAATASSA